MFGSDVPLTDLEQLSIPVIDREQIRLIQLLGSGAFGEVHEGVLYGETAQKIAVKMLRKGATEVWACFELFNMQSIDAESDRDKSILGMSNTSFFLIHSNVG